MARQSNSLKLLHIMAQERETRQRQREIARAETKRLAYNCRLSRANLQTALTAIICMERVMPTSTPGYYPFEERARATVATRATVEKWCTKTVVH